MVQKFPLRILQLTGASPGGGIQHRSRNSRTCGTQTPANFAKEKLRGYGQDWSVLGWVMSLSMVIDVCVSLFLVYNWYQLVYSDCSIPMWELLQ